MGSNPSLVVYPVTLPAIASVWDTLAQQLAAKGLLGKALAPEHFWAGEQLWDWVCLLGCVPVWQQSPEIRLAQFPQAQFWLSACAPRPRCPYCRSRSALPLEPYAAQPGAVPLWSCTGCGTVTPAMAWKLGRHAVCTTHWLAITPVYPGEAVPTDSLLEYLAGLTGGTWDYAYCGLCQTVT